MSTRKKRVIFIVGIMFFLIGTLSLVLSLYNNFENNVTLREAAL